MKKHIYLLLTITLFSLFNCEFNYQYEELWYDKYHFNDSTINHSTKFAGQVRSPITGEVIPNAEIQLKKETGRGIIGTSQTDENGYFALYFLSDTTKKEWFRVFVVKDNYLDAKLYFGSDTEVDSTYYSTIYLLPSAQLNIHIKNTSPYNSGDKISTGFGYGQNIYHDFIGQNPYQGASNFTFMTLGGEDVVGEEVNRKDSYYFPFKETVYIYWTVTKQGVATKYSDKVVLESKSTDYVIEY